MHLLMTTFAFLIIFAIFSYAQFQKLTETSFSETLYTTRFEAEANALSERFSNRAKALWYALFQNKKPETEPKSKSKRTGYLHIPSLIQRTDVFQETEESKSARALLKQLIFNLYAKKSFFIAANMDDAKVDALIDLMFKNAKDLAAKNYLRSPKALANVALNNEVYQEVLYKMLKGSIPDNEGEDHFSKTASNYKSLCNFIRFQKRRDNTLMSVYLAPPELLMALFQDQKVVKKIIAKREEIFQKLQDDKDKKLNEEQIASDFMNEFQPQIVAGIDKNFIDFKLSRTNPEDYAQDN